MADIILDGIIALKKAKQYTAESLDGLGALKGANCVIDRIDTVPEGNRITFSWTGASGVKEAQTILVKNGEQGKDGVGILKIEKINTVDIIDTYQITFTDNTTFEYSVTNGSNIIETYATNEDIDKMFL